MFCWIINFLGIRWINHRILTYEMKKTSLSCFDETRYIQSNGYDGLSLGYQS